MLKHLQWIVGTDEAGIRLDQWLTRRLPTVSRALVLSAIDTGRVRVNGARLRKKGHILRAGSMVGVEEVDEKSDVRIAPDPSVPLVIVREDAALVAVNKPAGMPCHPLNHRERGTLLNGLVARWPDIAGAGDDRLLGGLLHRIDTGTSGLVLAARRPDVWSNMRRQFQEQRVVKIYEAVVHGRIPAPGRLEQDLVHAWTGETHRMKVAGPAPSKGGRALHAVTEFQPLEIVGDFTRLEVKILTGVTHQIRCQLAAAGFPLVGDVLYGAPASEAALGRHWLHARSVAFADPESGEGVVCRCPPPEGFSRPPVMDA